MRKQIFICCGTGCRANKSMDVVDEFNKILATAKTQADVIAKVKMTGCNGFCENGPIVKIMPDNIVYYKVGVKDVNQIIEKSIQCLTQIGSRILGIVINYVPERNFF